MPNTPVSINTPTTTTIPPDVARTILGLSISDADGGAPGEVYTVSLMPSHGTLSLGSDAGITYYPEPIIGTVDMTNLGGEIFSAPPPGSLFIGGTLADINAALATLIFTPEAGYTGPGGFTFMVSDHATGGDARTSDYEAISLSIGGNQAPVIANLAGDIALYVEESLPVVVDLGANALVTDDSASFDGGSLTIAIVNRDTNEDIIYFDETVLSYGENDNGFNDVIVDGVVIGEMPLEYGTVVDDIAITFNANATAARVTMLLNALLYTNLDQVDPTEGTRTVRFALTDGSGPDAQTTTVDSFITVTDTPEINRQPVFDLDSSTLGVDVTRSTTEGAAAIALAPLATSDDPDLTAYNGGSLTVAVGTADAGDQLTLVTGGNVTLVAPNAIDVGGSGIVATWTGGTNGAPLVITFLPIGSVATTPEHVVDDIVKAIRYRTTSDAPAATRTITFTLNDGGGTDFGGDDTAVATATVNVTAVNDAPVHGLPTTVSTVEETSVGLNGGVAIDPPPSWISDADSATVTTTLSAADGTFSVTGSGTAVVGGNGTGTVTITGSVADVNLAVYHASYTPALDVTGSRTITVTTSDGSLSDSDTITVMISGARDTPEGADVTRTATEDTAYVLHAADFGFSDIDGDALAAIQLTSEPLHGQIVDIGGYGIDVTGDGNPDLIVSRHVLTAGSVIDLSLLAAGYIQYEPLANASGVAADSFTYQVVDNGATPFTAGTVDPTPNTLTFDIIAVNDAPVNVVGGAVNTTENTPVELAGMSVSDADAPGAVVYSLTVSNGVLNIRTDVVGGITAASIQVLAGTGNGTATINLSATVSQINATLAATGGLTFTPDAGFAGTATLQVYVNDAGQTGLDTNPVSILDPLADPDLGPLTEEDVDTRSIVVAAVDDPAVAQNDAVSTAENAVGTGSVFADNGLGADSDVDGPALTVAAVNGVALDVGQQITLASGALLTLNANGTYSYDPNGAFDYLIDGATAAATAALNTSALDSFTYTLANGNTATVTVTVNGVASVGDELWGSPINNTTTGTAGVDYFDLSQGGEDTAGGLDGNDAFYFGAAFTDGDTVDGGAGTNDQIGLKGDYSGANALTLGAGTITGIEVIAALPGFDYAITTNDANVAAGGTLTVFAGNLGAGDNFTFNGAAESDGKFMVYCGKGTDIVTTGAGNDGIYFGPGKFDPLVDRVDGGAGTNDQLALDGDYIGLMLDGTAIQNVEVIALLKGVPGDLAQYMLDVSASLVGAGETLTIWGTQVETSMTIVANTVSSGHLQIFGGTANDALEGGGSSDWFWGGLGGDLMVGGMGADTFYYQNAAESSAATFDRLFWFDDTTDKIDLDGRTVTGFAGPLSGALDVATLGTQLEVAATTLGVNQALEFTCDAGDLNGKTFLLIDGNGTAGYQANGDFLILLHAPMGPIDNLGMFI